MSGRHKFECEDCQVVVILRGTTIHASLVVLECPDCGEDLKWKGQEGQPNDREADRCNTGS